MEDSIKEKNEIRCPRDHVSGGPLWDPSSLRQAGERNEVAWIIKKYPGGHRRFNALWGTSVGFWLRLIQSILTAVGNAPRPKPFSLHNTLGFGG